MSQKEIEAWRLHRRINFYAREDGITIKKVSREGLGLYQLGEQTLSPYQVLDTMGWRMR
jgi:hypothetical protein